VANTTRSSSITHAGNWHPFEIRTHKPDAIRSLIAPGGVEDRLRVVAFAEVQARDAFRWGAARFPEAPAAWREEWLRFADVEDRHAQMLLDRMDSLGLSVAGRAVSDKLTRLCHLAEDPVTFLFLLSSAEERGMEAGHTLGQQMKPVDEASAAVFAQIASEEVEHVDSAKAALAGQDIEALRVKARALSKLI
jgi:uncharacterized ferritin-like protein (DUF455 family)